MEEKFNEKFNTYSNDKKLFQIPSTDKYNEMISTIQIAINNKDDKRSPKQFNLLRRYSIRMDNAEARLYHEERRVVRKEELFQLLDEEHKRSGHGGQNVMWKALRDYFGISKEVIGFYVNLCEACHLKRAKVKKGLVIKPILSEEFNSRCQCDLIDLQSRPDREYKFICVYQDHLTKYCILNPLKTKTANEVAEYLIKIFADFGAPKLLHSDNGREFANQVVRAVVWKWPECHIVHGKPRHSQSQGSVERCNRDVMDILTIWLREHRTTSWAKALPCVQIAKNRRYHRGIAQSPYEAMFGRKMMLGVEDGKVPTGEERGLTDGEEENEEPFITIDGTEFVTDVDERYVPEEHDTTASEDGSADEGEQSELKARSSRIINARYEAREAQKKQAEQMLESSSKRFAPVNVGTNVRLPIPDVDRSKIDPRNLLGVVLRITDDQFYEIGTKEGRLKQLYSRNQFEPCAEDFISAADVPDSETTLRTAVGGQSQTGTQGLVHCMCTTGCKTKKCKCKATERQCNSRCHHSNNCNNK